MRCNFQRNFLCNLNFFICVWHRLELHNSTRLPFAREIKPETCGHCTSFVHPSNYTAPGVIHGIKKSAQALEHWLRNVCKCTARSGSSTLWLRAHFSRLSFDIGKFSHYFSTTSCCLLGHRAQMERGTFERRKFWCWGGRGKNQILLFWKSRSDGRWRMRDGCTHHLTFLQDFLNIEKRGSC